MARGNTIFCLPNSPNISLPIRQYFSPPHICTMHDEVCTGSYIIINPYHYRRTIVFNHSEAEAKVYEATNNDPWGPSADLLREITEYTFHV